jgi:hypothetical protein
MAISNVAGLNDGLLDNREALGIVLFVVLAPE